MKQGQQLTISTSITCEPILIHVYVWAKLQQACFTRVHASANEHDAAAQLKDAKLCTPGRRTGSEWPT